MLRQDLRGLDNIYRCIPFEHLEFDERGDDDLVVGGLRQVVPQLFRL